jgi:hypothetical protein
MRAPTKRTTNVFLNVPFDEQYAPLYVALIAALTAFGRTPRTVLEIPTQEARLARLRAIIGACGASVHDLSRVETSGDPPVPRFNMPFELGLTLGMHQSDHAWFVFESVPHRIHRSLSDLGGHDAEVHDGKPEGILCAVTNAFGVRNHTVTHDDLITLWKALQNVVPRIRKERRSLFTPAAFADLVLSGQKLARARIA